MKIVEEYVHFIASNAVPKAMCLNDIKQATQNDPTLQELIRSARPTRPDVTGVDNATLALLSRLRSELMITDDNALILGGTCLIIPKSLQLAHEGHQGIVVTKILLRKKVWFPNIDQQAEDLVKGCLSCQATVEANNREPLKISPLSDTHLPKVDVDFCGPFPSDDYLLVVLDEYSRYPEVEIIKSTSANSVIPKLESFLPSVSQTKRTMVPLFKATNLLTSPSTWVSIIERSHHYDREQMEK